MAGERPTQCPDHQCRLSLSSADQMDENTGWYVCRAAAHCFFKRTHYLTSTPPNLEQIKSASASSSPHTYHLVLVPRRTTLCDRVLEEEGVFGEISISSYKLEFIPLEDDLLSLEWDSTFKEIFQVRRPNWRSPGWKALYGLLPVLLYL